jgi:hypothetical protein
MYYTKCHYREELLNRRKRESPGAARASNSLRVQYRTALALAPPPPTLSHTDAAELGRAHHCFSRPEAPRTLLFAKKSQCPSIFAKQITTERTFERPEAPRMVGDFFILFEIFFFSFLRRSQKQPKGRWGKVLSSSNSPVCSRIFCITKTCQALQALNPALHSCIRTGQVSSSTLTVSGYSVALSLSLSLSFSLYM